jgi:hypothetical protein
MSAKRASNHAMFSGNLAVQRHIQSLRSEAQQPAPRSNEASAHIERGRRQRRWGGEHDKPVAVRHHEQAADGGRAAAGVSEDAPALAIRRAPRPRRRRPWGLGERSALLATVCLPLTH